MGLWRIVGKDEKHYDEHGPRELRLYRQEMKRNLESEITENNGY